MLETTTKNHFALDANNHHKLLKQELRKNFYDITFLPKKITSTE